MFKEKQKLTQFHYAALVAVFLFIFFLVPGASADISKSEVVDLVNKSRSDAGLAPLSENPLLDKVARDKAEDMIKKDYFAHTSPQGLTPWHWFAKNNYDYKYAGENLAINFETAKSQHNAWMKSDTHRKNILNPTFKEIGVAIAEGKIDGEESIITVQAFGTPVVLASPLPKESLPAEKAEFANKPEVLPASDGLDKAVEAPAPVQESPALETPQVFPETKKSGYAYADLIVWVSVLASFLLSVSSANFLKKAARLLIADFKERKMHPRVIFTLSVDEYEKMMKELAKGPKNITPIVLLKMRI